VAGAVWVAGLNGRQACQTTLRDAETAGVVAPFPYDVFAAAMVLGRAGLHR